MTPRCGILVAVIAIVCLVQHVSSLAPYYAVRSEADRVGQGKYIVVLKNDGDTKMDATAFVTREFSSELPLTTPYQIEHVYEHAINGFSATLTDEEREQMRNLPEVDYIEEVVGMSIQCTSSPPSSTPAPTVPSWGLDRIDQRDLPLNDVLPTYQVHGGRGAGVHIYILDTGVQRTHNEFAGRFSNDGFDALGEDSFGIDCHGHGTHVAATAAGATYGVATEATVHSVRVADCFGDLESVHLIAGMNWVAANAAQTAIVSISIAGPNTRSVNDAVKKLTEMGVVVIVAAGNRQTDACGSSPANAPNAITVGATQINNIFNDVVWPSSNFGTCLDIFAPGHDIKSAWRREDDATAILSGTSQACPHVSGVAAILLSRATLLPPPPENVAFLKTWLIRLSTVGKLSIIWAGSPNRLLYIDREDAPE